MERIKILELKTQNRIRPRCKRGREGAASDINQNIGLDLDKKEIVKQNLMNSRDNKDWKLASDKGTKVTKGQINKINRNVQNQQ